MSTAIRPQSGDHATEQIVGRILSMLWLAAAAFFPAAVVGSAVGNNQIANLAWLAFIAVGIFAVLQWERVAAIAMVLLVLAGAILIVVSAQMQTSVNMPVVMFAVLPAFAIPGILGAALMLHSERR